MHHWSMVSWQLLRVLSFRLKRFDNTRFGLLLGKWYARGRRTSIIDGLCKFCKQGINLDPDFGFAPSTLVYQGESNNTSK